MTTDKIAKLEAELLAAELTVREAALEALDKETPWNLEMVHNS